MVAVVNGSMGVERAERKRRIAAWRLSERAAARARLPGPEVQLRALFDDVNQHLQHGTCDHTLRFARAWLTANDIPAQPVVAWLQENGGHCDCEVIANAEQAFEAATGVSPRCEPDSGGGPL